MKIAFLASEVVPFAKTGGLADVAGALPKVLSRRGADVRVFLPYYRSVKSNAPALSGSVAFDLDWAGRRERVQVFEHRADGFAAHFVVHDGYFDREFLYGPAAGDYPDNGERFAFFCRASLEAMRALGFAPDVLHGHDWQAATAFAYLKHVLGGDPFFARTGTLFTIHNLAYQGLFERGILSRAGLPDSLFNMHDLEFFGRVNYMKAGILYADGVSTVSPRYSREIQTPEFGCGLDGLLRSRSNRLFGLLNGVDYADWDPVTDTRLPANYDLRDLGGKRTCRTALLREFGLPAGPGLPVVGMVTRLAGQKGLDIVCEALEGLFELGCALIILGTGDEKIRAFLEAAAKKRPDRLGLRIAFDDRVARLIYAGSDLFLIPSRYEPCGLTQMYSLKYGTVPVVRATGGLDDSIREFDPAAGTGTGFKFVDATAPALLGAVKKALAVRADVAYWLRLVRNGMAEDFSWDRSAAAYLDRYEKLAAARR
jgi:starch synthase